MGSAATYLSTKEPTKFRAVISYSDANKNDYDESIAHDLPIYGDLPHELGSE